MCIHLKTEHWSDDGTDSQPQHNQSSLANFSRQLALRSQVSDENGNPKKTIVFANTKVPHSALDMVHCGAAVAVFALLAGSTLVAIQ